jgi:hypothetical protein
MSDEVLSVRSVSSLCSKAQLPLRESLETAVSVIWPASKDVRQGAKKRVLLENFGNENTSFCVTDICKA